MVSFNDPQVAYMYSFPADQSSSLPSRRLCSRGITCRKVSTGTGQRIIIFTVGTIPRLEPRKRKRTGKVAHHTVLGQVMLRAHRGGDSPIIAILVHTKPRVGFRVIIRFGRSVLYYSRKYVTTTSMLKVCRMPAVPTCSGPRLGVLLGPRSGVRYILEL
jgi:hypothetical protein